MGVGPTPGHHLEPPQGKATLCWDPEWSNDSTNHDITAAIAQLRLASMINHFQNNTTNKTAPFTNIMTKPTKAATFIRHCKTIMEGDHKFADAGEQQ